MRTIESPAGSTRTTVKVLAGDPVSEAGVRTHLRTRPEIALAVGGDPSDDPQVTVIVADTVSEDVLVLLRKTRRTSSPPHPG